MYILSSGNEYLQSIENDNIVVTDNLQNAIIMDTHREASILWEFLNIRDCKKLNNTNNFSIYEIILKEVQ